MYNIPQTKLESPVCINPCLLSFRATLNAAEYQLPLGVVLFVWGGELSWKVRSLHSVAKANKSTRSSVTTCLVSISLEFKWPFSAFYRSVQNGKKKHVHVTYCFKKLKIIVIRTTWFSDAWLTNTLFISVRILSACDKKFIYDHFYSLLS